MSSNQKVILKILIDYSEYQRLKDCESQVKEIHSKQKKELELVPNTPVKEPLQVGSGHQIEPTTETSNLSHKLLPEEYQLIAKAVSDQIAQNYNLSQLQDFVKTYSQNVSNSTIQKGLGSNDLLIPQPSYTESNITAPSTAENIIISSKLNDKYDNEELLKIIPSRFHEKAKALLEIIDRNPSDLTFNANGEIFLNNQNIPNANIRSIFPALFLMRKKNIPGLQEVTTKLAELNLGHLFNKGMLKSLKRPKNYKLATFHDYKKFKYWWYMGQ